ncbi:MAG: hypothetical protein KDC54_13380, partial [Lewinella sp.]|nr:hypothetical protein [Lewinella sp.]
QEQIMAQPGVRDNWLVIGQQSGTEEQLTYRRTWLRGETTGRCALLLDFAYGRQGFDAQWVVGSVLQGELIFYPGTTGQRARFRQQTPSRAPYESPPGYPDLTAAGVDYAKALAASPWLNGFPLLLEEITPLFREEAEGSGWIVDQRRQLMPLARTDQVWPLLAHSGGRPITVFGEYNGETFSPLSVITEGRVFAL